MLSKTLCIPKEKLWEFIMLKWKPKIASITIVYIKYNDYHFITIHSFFSFQLLGLTEIQIKLSEWGL